jgi:hypothetical protein
MVIRGLPRASCLETPMNRAAASLKRVIIPSRSIETIPTVKESRIV